MGNTMPTIKRVPITDIVVPDVFLIRCQSVTEEERLAFEPIINRDPLPVVYVEGELVLQAGAKRLAVAKAIGEKEVLIQIYTQSERERLEATLIEQENALR